MALDYCSSRKVGVVIIGRNEGLRLTRCLQSLDLRNTKAVYVDSGSVDDSMDNARKHGVIAIALDSTKRFTAARARNAGYQMLKMHHAPLEYIFFIDGDCSVTAGWLSMGMEFLDENQGVVAVCGRRKERNPGFSIYNWLCDLEWETPIGEADACGGDVLIRTAPFESCGGYCEALVAGEEPELCLRLREAGWKIWRIDAQITEHDAAISKFSQWWRRCTRGGYGMMEVAMLHFRSPCRIWVREVLRAVFYGGFIPIVLAVGIYYPILFAAVLVYPLQIVRIALRRGVWDPKSWIYASMLTISKFAEFSGISKFIVNCLRRKSGEIIEYK